MKNKIKAALKTNPTLRQILAMLYGLRFRSSRKIRGHGNTILTQGAFLKGCRFDITGSNNTITVEPMSRLANVTFKLLGDNHTVHIGENCLVKNTTLWTEDDGCMIRIGRDTSMEGGAIAATEPGSTITIGQDCMFSFDIDIRSGDSHSIIDLETGKRINHAQDVQIGDHVWLGADVRIMKGVAIGEHAVVGGGSTVTGDVPAHAIAAGIPARVVKENVAWARERIYDCVT